MGGAASGTDSTHPSLTVSQAGLVLGGNTMTVVTGTALGVGVYTLVSAPDGGITGTVNATPDYTGGNGVTLGLTGTLSISSDGKAVLLSVVSQPYEDWARNMGLTGGPGSDRDPSPTADPDGDGTINLIEFAFNGNPRDGADNGRIYSLTAVASDYGTDKVMILTVGVRAGTPATWTPSNTATIDGITYTIEGSIGGFSFDGSIWSNPTAMIVGDMPATPGAGYEYRSFVLEGSSGLPNKGFMRAKVVKNQ